MEVLASVKLHYESGDNWRDEGLYAMIRFKEKGKIRKTKLRRYLLRYDNREESYEDYVKILVHLSNNKSKVVDAVKDIVKEYFEDKFKIQSNNDEVKDALLRLEELREFEIKVKID